MPGGSGDHIIENPVPYAGITRIRFMGYISAACPLTRHMPDSQTSAPPGCLKVYIQPLKFIFKKVFFSRWKIQTNRLSHQGILQKRHQHCSRKNLP